MTEEKTMPFINCKRCGGQIMADGHALTAICTYCNTEQTLPRLGNDDARANLYGRANHFRRNNEFDKAMGIYETILNEDRTDAEAYWSIVLCRWGVEYVQDPATGRRIPTVNRAQYTSIYDDEDYRAALQYATVEQKRIYEEEARAINDIQRGILEISEREDPFDVFICYKESDANGNRTHDSVIAAELYQELTREGFKVFFSRITLEDKLGMAYEPYIFAALNSAKVMVVLGSKSEHFNAVWVKNEWSRFLALVKQSEGKKVLIPAYRDMDAYDLPDEFAHLQAQDMSRLGFMQDLVRGIRKIIGVQPAPETRREAPAAAPAPEAAHASEVTPLLRRAQMFLEDGDFENADAYCERVLDIEPENAEAYLVKLMVDLKIKTRANIINHKQPLEVSRCYEKLLRYADPNLRREMSELNEAIKNRIAEEERVRAERIAEENRTHAYNDAQFAMECARSEEAFLRAAEMFETLGDYRDSLKRLSICREQAAYAHQVEAYNAAEATFVKARKESNAEHFEKAIRLYTKAAAQFAEVGDWKDAVARVQRCNERISDVQELQRQAAARAAAAIENERRQVKRKKNTKILKWFLVLGAIAAVIVGIVVWSNVILPNKWEEQNEVLREQYREKYGDDMVVATKKEMPYLKIVNGAIEWKTSKDLPKNLVIPHIFNGELVTSISSGAFDGIDQITSVTIPNSVTSLGYEAFYRCGSLTQITIPDSVTNIGKSAFKSCPIQKATLPALALSSIDKSSLKEVIVTSGTSIADSTFMGCHNLTSITIPDSVTSIGKSAFSGCRSLVNITIPDGVTYIGMHAFFMCGALTSITIPSGVTFIGDSLFNECTSLTNIDIHGKLTYIGRSPFGDCSALTSITYNGTMEEWKSIEKTFLWDYGAPSCTVYCTDGELILG